MGLMQVSTEIMACTPCMPKYVMSWEGGHLQLQLPVPYPDLTLQYPSPMVPFPTLGHNNRIYEVLNYWNYF
jgi:hypothetical protein